MHDDTAWRKFRRLGLGASDMPAVMGTSRWGSPYTIWAEKVGLLPPRVDDDAAEERKQIGKDAEGYLAAVFERRTGLDIIDEQAQAIHPSERWARCTLDGVVAPPDHTRPAISGWEAKTAREFGWPDGPPPAYIDQCQWQMFVCGTQRVWLTVGFSGWRVELFEVMRDPARIAELVMHGDHLWHEHICTGVAPPIDASEATSDALAALFPDSVPNTTTELERDVYANWDAARQTRLDADREAKAAKVEEDLWRNRIVAEMGDAEVACIDGVPVVSCRTQERRTIDAKALKEFLPGVYADYVRTTTFRTLRPATKKDRHP